MLCTDGASKNIWNDLGQDSQRIYTVAIRGLLSSDEIHYPDWVTTLDDPPVFHIDSSICVLKFLQAVGDPESRNFFWFFQTILDCFDYTNLEQAAKRKLAFLSSDASEDLSPAYATEKVVTTFIGQIEGVPDRFRPRKSWAHPIAILCKLQPKRQLWLPFVSDHHLEFE